MARIWETIAGVWALLRLGIATRFRFHGSYWSWRLDTALGGRQPGRWEMVRFTLAYARWMHRMRRGG